MKHSQRGPQKKTRNSMEQLAGYKSNKNKAYTKFPGWHKKIFLPRQYVGLHLSENVT